MTLLDWALLLLVLGTSLSGFWAGAVRIVFGFGGAAAGIWLAVVAGADLATALGDWLEPPGLAAVAARALLLVLGVGLCMAAGWGIERTLQAVKLGWVNRVLGALLAGAASVVVLGALLVTGARLSPPFAALCDRSLLPPPLLDLVGGTRSDEPRTPPEAPGEGEGESPAEAEPGSTSAAGTPGTGRWRGTRAPSAGGAPWLPPWTARRGPAASGGAWPRTRGGRASLPCGSPTGRC